jgi:DNA repair protein RadC
VCDVSIVKELKRRVLLFFQVNDSFVPIWLVPIAKVLSRKTPENKHSQRDFGNEEIFLLTSTVFCCKVVSEITTISNGRYDNMNEKQQLDELRKRVQINPQFLTDSELIAFLLRSGNQGKKSVELAEELLTQVGGLSGLLKIQQQPSCQIEGVGGSHYILLKAIVELAWRVHKLFEHSDTLPVFEETYQFLLLELKNLRYQALFVLFLDKQHSPIALEQIILSDVDNSVVYESKFILEEILKQASQYQETTFILAHNSPNGDGYPMPIDIFLSQKMVRELFALELQMLDYIVVGKFHHTLLAEKGFLEL